MRTDKAFLEFRGRTLLDRALETMRKVCGEVSIVGDPEKFASYGPVINDVFPDCGPLSGIHAALFNSSTELTLVIAVDMPFVSGELLGFLLAVAAETRASVVVPRTGRGLQPLCAVYRRAFGVVAEDALQAGKYKIDALYPQVGVRIIEEEELSQAGFTERMFWNVNTPNDLRAAENAG